MLKTVQSGTRQGTHAADTSRAALLQSGKPPTQAESKLARKQSAYGNQRMQRSLGGRVLQRKLTINEPGDAYEQEADRMADAVMGGPYPAASHQAITHTDSVTAVHRCSCGASTSASGQCEECKAKAVPVQRSASVASPSATAPPIVHDVLRSPGQPLDATTRGFMEPRFGIDFSHVRVHTDARAAESARAVDALAYTVGEHVVFGDRQYSPGTRAGQRLLAHELTHVVQRGEQALRRWKISGDNATSDSKSDTLDGLAVEAGATSRDWKCIIPVSMRALSTPGATKNRNDEYDKFVGIGDQFDISNLTATKGPDLKIHLFNSESKDAALATRFYPGIVSSADPDASIEDTAKGGKTPLGEFLIFGHAVGGAMFGGGFLGGASLTPGKQNPEGPNPRFSSAREGNLPRRCWFTRNASARAVGCESKDWAESFAGAYLRRGAKITATTSAVRPWCDSTKMDRGTCYQYTGLEFATNFSSTAPRKDGPFTSVGSFHASKFWATITGRL